MEAGSKYTDDKFQQLFSVMQNYENCSEFSPVETQMISR